MTSISGGSSFRQSTLPPIDPKVTRPASANIPSQAQAGQLTRPSTAIPNKVTSLPPLVTNKSVFATSKQEAVAEKTEATVKRSSLPPVIQASTSRQGSLKKAISNMNSMSPSKGLLPKIPGTVPSNSSPISKETDKIKSFVNKTGIKNGTPKEELREEYEDDFIPLEESSKEYSDDFLPLKEQPTTNQIPNSSSITQQDQSPKSNALQVQFSPFIKNGDIDHQSDSQRLASSLREESHVKTLALPFKSLENRSLDLLSASLDQSFIEHLGKIKEENIPFKPEAGNNGVTRVMRDMVIKADDLDGLKRQAAMGKILDHYKMKTPESHLLGKSATQVLSSSLPDFNEKLTSQSSEPAGALVMGKVKGVTFGAIISEAVEGRKNPAEGQKNNLFHTFCSQIDNRMQELGNLAALDMLIGNSDRLVKTAYNSDNPDHQLREAMVNVGNWMYMTDEGNGVKSPSHLGKIVPIDNSCFDFPYAGEEDTEKNKKSQVDSFLNLMKQPQKIAQHIIDGLDFNLSGEYNLHLKENSEAVFGKGITLERLTENIEKGIRSGIDVIKSSKDDQPFFRELIHSPNTSEQDQLIYATILARAEGLK
jgi:hypothetical protein